MLLHAVPFATLRHLKAKTMRTRAAIQDDVFDAAIQDDVFDESVFKVVCGRKPCTFRHISEVLCFQAGGCSRQKGYLLTAPHSQNFIQICLFGKIFFPTHPGKPM